MDVRYFYPCLYVACSLSVSVSNQDREPCETAESIEMPFGLLQPAERRIRCGYMGVTWQIRLNDPCSLAIDVDCSELCVDVCLQETGVHELNCHVSVDEFGFFVYWKSDGKVRRRWLSVSIRI